MCGGLASVSWSMSNREGEPKSWHPHRGTELRAIPAVVGQPWDVLLEAAFSSRNPFAFAFDYIRTQVLW